MRGVGTVTSVFQFCPECVLGGRRQVDSVESVAMLDVNIRCFISICGSPTCGQVRPHGLCKQPMGLGAPCGLSAVSGTRRAVVAGGRLCLCDSPTSVQGLPEPAPASGLRTRAGALPAGGAGLVWTIGVLPRPRNSSRRSCSWFRVFCRFSLEFSG